MNNSGLIPGRIIRDFFSMSSIVLFRRFIIIKVSELQSSTDVKLFLLVYSGRKKNSYRIYNCRGNLFRWIAEVTKYRSYKIKFLSQSLR
jgi:hypothetical protein